MLHTEYNALPHLPSLIANSYTQNIMGYPTFISLIANSYTQNIMGYPTRMEGGGNPLYSGCNG
jgi:hypothetical protein